jgi:hypothetical protein
MSDQNEPDTGDTENEGDQRNEHCQHVCSVRLYVANVKNTENPGLPPGL